MKKIYNNLNIENLIKTDWFEQFNEYQQEEIEKGLQDNLDISLFANPAFNLNQMKQIRIGLEDNVDVSIYANSDFSNTQMFQIVIGLMNGLDVSIYAKKELDWKQMFEIREKLLEEEKEKLDNEQENI